MSSVATVAIKDWVAAAARAAEEGPGADTVVIDVGEVMVITDFFVITSGANTRSVRGLVERIEEAVDDSGGPKPISIEGLSDPQWVLMDYGSFTVHIFTSEARSYYSLESLWKDCPRVLQ